MVSAALRRAIVGVTFMLLGSACVNILGDFKLKTDVCSAGQDNCCLDGGAGVDECTTGGNSCSQGCAGTDGCDANARCIEAITFSGSGALCPDSPASDAYVDLEDCLCDGDCQGDCESTLCSGRLPPSSQCMTCMARSADCKDEYIACTSE